MESEVPVFLLTTHELCAPFARRVWGHDTEITPRLCTRPNTSCCPDTTMLRKVANRVLRDPNEGESTPSLMGGQCGERLGMKAE